MTIKNSTIEPVLVSVVDKTSPSLVRGTPQAAGLDIKACIQGSESIKPDEVKMIKTGLRMALPDGSFGMIVPRSGLGTKHGIVLANSVGIIDSDYRGEILVPLKNTSNTTFTVEPDMRIAQMIILEHKSDCCFVEISDDEMSKSHVSERNMGGFGSTGVN